MRLWKRWWRQTRKSREGIAEAELALQREQEARKQVESKRPEVNELARELAQHRTQNHFAEMLIEAMRRRA